MECFVTNSSRSSPEPSLLEQVGQARSGATDALVERYGALVWSLAIRSCFDRAEAEDAVQDIFISLWQNADRFDPTVASEATFVAMIARRRLVDRRRRSSRRPEHGAGGGEWLERMETSPPTDAVERQDEAGHVFKAMAELRPEQQRVLMLSIAGERTYEQIAEALGMPIGTVKTHARRGLIRLRDLLAGSAGSLGVEART
jgi:RNA polymerase sigma-70 factor (ECF subfamily)